MHIKTINGSDASKCDNNLSASLIDGLKEAPTLPVLMIVSALVNSLHHNGRKMIASGMCLEAQRNAGMEQLQTFVNGHYKREREY